MRALAAGLATISCAIAQAQDTTENTLEQVTISAERDGDQSRKQVEAERAATPGGVTVVEGEGLRLRNVTSLTDMLRYVPGVWAASGSTGDSSFLSIRGSNLDATNYDGNGVKLLIDGLPVTAADGSNHNRDVDPLSMRRAIVARGANALTYGASTLGGAINFITPTARDGAPSEAVINGGSHGQRQARFTVGGVAGNFDALVTAEAKRSDGFRDHQRQERQGLYANAGLQLGEALSTRFYLTSIDNDQQLPGTLTRAQFNANPRAAQAAAVAGNYRLNVRTLRVANRTVWDIDADSSLTAGISFEKQKLYHPIVYAPPFFSLLIDTTLRNLGTTLRYQRRAGDHDFLAGLNYGRTSVKGGNYSYVTGGPQTINTGVDNNADNVELFVVDRWKFAPQWTAVYGAQMVSGSREIRNTNVATGAVRNPKADFDSINPRIGVIRELSPTAQLFANVSRLYEAPTLYELDDDVRGNNSTLDAMRGVVLEVGTRGSHMFDRHRVHWDTAVYYGRLNGEILSRDDPNAPGTSLSTNVGKTLHAGVEALVGASLAMDGAGAHRLEPLVNITLNQFEFKNDSSYRNNRLPAAPRYTIKGEVLYRHASGIFFGPTFDVVGRRFADFSNTYTVDSYSLWGLRAGYTTPQWEVYAELRNASNKKYVSYFSVRDIAAANAAILTPGEPRSLYMGARLKF
ncbi:TonB-dependent receptor [Acidovorax sp. Be4]|uniref:TonB-dependent receptor n=1 Tax=Acidovorax bellezanensis TaxID=2976702 RepID=A0ABT2PRL8_9BURK|nr:TonB-dependent receptor [Acidovorax sp. Be4]MCT9811763.1 TonB-dependent receptor [Acidovorax sp. Be4]